MLSIKKKIFLTLYRNGNLRNCYDSGYLLNGTSNTYDLQSVYNGNEVLGIMSDSSQVYLTMYDTAISPYTYTGNGNIDVTDNEVSLTFPLTNNGEVVLNPRVNGYFEVYAAPNGISILKNIVDGSQPTAFL